jgi:hypothetical protein
VHAGSAAPSLTDLDATSTPVAGELLVELLADDVVQQSKTHTDLLSLSSGGATSPYCFVNDDTFSDGNLSSTAELSYSCSTKVKDIGVLSVALVSGASINSSPATTSSRRLAEDVPRRSLLQTISQAAQPSTLPAFRLRSMPTPEPEPIVCKVR